ncbi:MAG: NAD(P)H-dependent oxidoreductase [Oscillospiraceae bacterium]|nr:NAD(P)H-dependent oxidoreductase [Oscillospiraceae bacterium]
MKTLLFVNCCLRGESSRTLRLCNVLLSRLAEAYHIEQCDLATAGFAPLTADDLAARDALADESAPFLAAARQFAAADLIVIGAPYWDLSFPAALRVYLEQVSLIGVTFHYTEDGRAAGLCNAEKLIYITTAGGFIGANNYGYDYLTALCRELFGIAETAFVSAEGMDIIGYDAEGALQRAEAALATI